MTDSRQIVEELAYNGQHAKTLVASSRASHASMNRAPLPIPQLTPKMLARFWANVDKGGCLRCWTWAGSTTGGYGTFTFAGHNFRAHRIAWTLLRGAIPTDLQIDHVCRNRACVNPDHLELVTVRENVLGGIGPSAVSARRDRCQDGHLYVAGSYRMHRGRRLCLVCQREYHLAHENRKRSEGLRRLPRKKWYCEMCDRWFHRKDGGDCRLCGSTLLPAIKPPEGSRP